MQVLEKTSESFADWDAGEREKLISRLRDKMQALSDLSAAGSSAAKAKKPVLDHPDFLMTAGVYVENIAYNRDISSNLKYACDFIDELKLMAKDIEHKYQIRQQKKQKVQELKAKNEKLPPELTKKGYEKLMSQKKEYIKEQNRVVKRLNKVQNAVVDFSKPEDELHDSNYLKEHKYRKRLIFLQNKIRELDETPALTVPRPLYKRFKFKESPSGFQDLDSAVANYMNTRLQQRNFDSPDFIDVKTFVKEHKPDLSDDELAVLSQKVFAAVGKELRKRRMEETADSTLR